MDITVKRNTSRNPRNGIVYVYDNWVQVDPETGLPKKMRKLVGKLNDAGEVVPTDRPGHPRKPVDPEKADAEYVQKYLDDYEARVADQYKLIEELTKTNAELGDAYFALERKYKALIKSLETVLSSAKE